MKFRKAKLSELKQLNQISLLSKKHWGYPDDWIRHWTDGLTLSIDDLNTLKVTVLEMDSEPVGFCAIAEHADAYEIEHLWLLPEFIGKGLGRKLLQYVLNQIILKKLPVIVEADPNAEVFYAKQGFQTFDRKESFPKGRFLPVMRKDPV
jgi:N-acetylglutamate synthase-like GNAT family acetyltransferase